MRKIKNSKFLVPGVLCLVVLGAFLVRVLPLLDNVFWNGNVFFLGNDPWYHMRLVDVMLENFPWPLAADPFREGSLTYSPLLTYMISIPALLGLNKELVAVYIPPIVGALTAIPVYFLGRELLGSRAVGVMASILVLVLPTELLHRSFLGFADHHFLEVFFNVTLILFLILAMKKQQIRYAVLAGVTFGLLSLAWTGFLIVLPIIAGWFLITFLYNYYKDKEGNKFLCKTMSITMGITFFIFTPYWTYSILPGVYPVTLISLSVLPWVLVGLSQIKNKKVFTGTLVGAIAVGSTGVVLAFPGLVEQALIYLERAFLPGAGFGTVQEARPADLNMIITTYGITAVLALIGIIHFTKVRPNLLILFWFIFMFALMMVERRWEYYFVVPASLFASYMVATMASWVAKEARIGLVVVMSLFIFIPALVGMWPMTNIGTAMSPDWYYSMEWLRENTEQPYTQEDAYYSLKVEEEPSYKVMSWWDWGFFILKEGHRAPVSDPGQRDVEVAAEFLVYGNGTPKYVVLGDHRDIYPAFEVWLGLPGNQARYENSYYWYLYTEQAPEYTKVYQHGQVKIFERN